MNFELLPDYNRLSTCLSMGENRCCNKRNRQQKVKEKTFEPAFVRVCHDPVLVASAIFRDQNQMLTAP